MRLNKQHKSYIAVLGLALAGLMIDRFVVGYGATEPAGASALVGPALAVDREELASAATAAGRSVSPPRRDTPALAIPGMAMISVARRIEQSAERWQLPSQGEDAFAPTPGWSAAVHATGQSSRTDREELETSLRAEASRMKLTAVMGSLRVPASLLAVIDERTLRLGDVIGGFKLVAVEKRHAVLEREGFRFEVGLSE